MKQRDIKEINKSISFYMKLVKKELGISRDLRDMVALKRYISNVRKLRGMLVQ